MFMPDHPHAIPVLCTLLSASQNARTWWCVIHSPSVSSKRSTLRAGHRAEHGKHGGGAPLSSVPLILGVVLAEHGGCLSSVDRDRELRIWNEREARRNECETRRSAYLERVRSLSTRMWDSLLVDVGTSEELVTGVIPKSQIFLGCWSWRKSHNWDRSFDPEPLALACEPTQS